MSITKTWNSSFEADPAGGDNPSGGDDDIRDTKTGVRERVEREHLMATGDTNSKHGWHREGSARAFVATSAPTATSDPDTTSLGSDATIDEGRLWFDSDDDYLPKVYDAGWQRFIREIARVSIQGTLAAGTAVVPPVIFPRACKVVKVSGRVLTAPTTNSLLIDINKNGSSSIFNASADRIAIQPAGYADSSTTMQATNCLLTADDYLTVDIDQVGGTTKGSDLSLTIEVVLG